MKISDILSEADKEKLSAISAKRKENLSRHELEEIMGIRRDKYKRVRGKIRRY